MSNIKVMFDPQTITLIGATEKEGAVGRTILENLLRLGRSEDLLRISSE